MDLWPHQTRGIDETLDAISRGIRRIVLTSPTGGGKTRMVERMIQVYTEAKRKVSLYSNRRLLIDQLSRSLDKAGIDYGVRAAGAKEEQFWPVQISSVQTEASKVLKRKEWKLHESELVIVDEGHLFTEGQAVELMRRHHEGGAAIVYVTATPLGMKAVADNLVVAGTTSELIKCGALVPCYHYGCDEPDLTGIGQVVVGEELSEPQQRKVMMRPGVFGRVLKEFNRLNPHRYATILFAPDVAGSIYFMEQFQAAGITAAHIDGECVVRNGKVERTSRSAREEVLEDSKNGRIVVLCNRYVLREGIDAPWLRHAVFATVYGSVGSYLQSGGRLLRAHPSLTHVTLQDHGGNWWRHGSLNSDRTWSLEYSGRIYSGLREERLRGKAEREPFICPECQRVLNFHRCPCGFVIDPQKPQARVVIQSDGTLLEMQGDIYKPRRVSTSLDAHRLWASCYFRAKNSKKGMTFKQAEALFVHEDKYHRWPPRELKYMPLEPLDWFRRVAEVPTERLRS